MRVIGSTGAGYSDVAELLCYSCCSSLPRHLPLTFPVLVVMGESRHAIVRSDTNVLLQEG